LGDGEGRGSRERLASAEWERSDQGGSRPSFAWLHKPAKLAHEEHNPDSPNQSSGEPKIHFHLAGYDILFRAQDNLSGFHNELVKRVVRRQQHLV
jgi:hypothetical protein